ncbi:MAG: hypothetical protein Q9227_004046 [Pyrenula ochraceoflavens]
MESLTLKPRKPQDEEIECWDDDADFGPFEDVHFRTASTTTSITSSSHVAHHRDSTSSRFSTRSDRDSNMGDEDWQVLLPEDDNMATKDAIASAKSKGIPIPEDVPKSALLGGTIRRLGGKKIKKAMGDDWSEDLELPGMGGLKLAKPEGYFPTDLRQISAAFQKSPIKKQEFKSEDVRKAVEQTIASTTHAAPTDLAQFRDTEEDGFGDMTTIKVSKVRSPRKMATFHQPPPQAKQETDNFEDDFELPTDGHLKLSARKELPRTPHQDDDVDLEWAEGSLGTRLGGTRRDVRSNRSSSVSAMSPSVSSCLTAESEDEGLDGLVLPNGPLKFQDALKKRTENTSPDPANYSGDRHAAKRAAAKEDFFSGLEIGDGDVFDSGKLTLNRNVKHRIQRTTSPTRPKTATALTFTNNKPQTTRIPRLHQSFERPRSTLEPVSESGVPFPRYRRSESRMGGHSAQSSISSIPTPTTPSTPSTPNRRGLFNQSSNEGLRRDPITTTNAQLLKAKRSMPAMRNVHSPSKPPPNNRPPSRTESGSRLHIPPRPKTPTDRSESALAAARRPPVPFVPAGASTSQSHHVSVKTSRHFRRHDSEGSNDSARPISRASHLRPETPGRSGAVSRRGFAPAELIAAAKKPLSHPLKRHNFGDGSELDSFDDLHVSTATESKFTKQPIAKGPHTLRKKLGQTFNNQSTSSLASTLASRTDTATPVPTTPLSPTKQDLLPRFARDTAASRNARGSRQPSATVNTRDHGPLSSLTTNWKANLSRTLQSPNLLRKKKPVQTKPHLIKPMGDGVHQARSVKGMLYNPVTQQWEGNENVLTDFDLSSTAVAPHSPRSPKPAPALITNVGSSTGFQVVGGMVFDPQRMCWLKMAPNSKASSSSLRGGISAVQLDDEEDVFAGLEDLKEEDERSRTSNAATGPYSRKTSSRKDPEEAAAANRDADNASGGGESSDEYAMNEEFDVGPDFVRRQRHEEERWRRKVERWLKPGNAIVDVERGREPWRWAIREIAKS